MSGAPAAEVIGTHGGPSPPFSSPPLATSTDRTNAHENGCGQATPVEHRRNRKSWTEEEKCAFWKQKKQQRKERQKAVARARQETQQAEWERLTEEEKEGRKKEAATVHERRRQAEEALVTRCEAQLSDPHVPVLVFDLSFAWCMTVADTKSTVSQVKFSYSSLRSAGFPLRPVITSLSGKEKTDTAHDASAQHEVLEVLQDFEGFRRFPPQITEDTHWSELFPASHVVFLTADAEELLTAIEPNTAYIIGAFVDHNQYKNLSHATAQRHGVRTARLPIKESVELGNRCKVLTINHVVDVLIKYEALRAAGTPSWALAIDTALPIRRTQPEVLGYRKRSRRSATDSAVDSSDDHEDDEGGGTKGEKKM